MTNFAITVYKVVWCNRFAPVRNNRKGLDKRAVLRAVVSYGTMTILRQWLCQIKYDYAFLRRRLINLVVSIYLPLTMSSPLGQSDIIIIIVIIDENIHLS